MKMNDTVARIVEIMFQDVEMNEETAAIRDEVMDYCQERYQDLVNSGMTEDDAVAAVIESLKGMEDVLAELADRYGPVPECVRGLTQVSFVRIGAAALGIYEIGQKADNLLLYSDGITRGLVRRLLPALGRRAAVNAGAKPYLSVNVGKDEKGIDVLTAALEAWEKAKAEAANDPPEPETPVPAAPASNGLYSARSTGKLNTAPAHTVRASHYGNKKR